MKNKTQSAKVPKPLRLAPGRVSYIENGALSLPIQNYSYKDLSADLYPENSIHHPPKYIEKNKQNNTQGNIHKIKCDIVKIDPFEALYGSKTKSHKNKNKDREEEIKDVPEDLFKPKMYFDWNEYYEGELEGILTKNNFNYSEAFQDFISLPIYLKEYGKHHIENISPEELRIRYDMIELKVGIIYIYIYIYEIKY